MSMNVLTSTFAVSALLMSQLVLPPGVYGHAEPVRSEPRMDWRGASPVQKQFMHSVYQGHVYRSAQRGTFVGDVASSRLARIEKQHQAQIEAAKACQELLKAARADLAQQKPEQAIQLDIEYVSIISAYRSASQQFFKWQTNFPSYYRQTRPQRSAVPGGEHGTAAVQFMIQYIGRRLAAPGYSLHNSGLAVDFGTKEGGRNLTPDTSSANVRHWRGSWLFHWLSANASRFGYYQNTSIDEPWHWEYEKVIR